MKAAVISGPGVVEVQSLPDPTPGPKEVVIAVLPVVIAQKRLVCGLAMGAIEYELANSDVSGGSILPFEAASERARVRRMAVQ